MTGQTLTLKDIQPAEGGPIPPAWVAAMAHLHDATIARDELRSAATQQLRDDAAVRFGQEIEKLFEQMKALRDSGATGVISNFLCRRPRHGHA